ncbi:MAG TPA: hypothetical protein VER55_17020 [Ardenticatenaceae bacterium]|nr:hypothetical protein [Ardenticatenaceae bacterium]
MDRGIPAAGNEEIELYIRTYYSLLRSSGAIRVRALEETHAGMRSSLHAKAEEPLPDVAAFTYAILRLPPCIFRTTLVLLGQSEEVFARRGYPEAAHWQEVTAAARRRKMFFNGTDTLAAFIASVSDIDDLIPLLTTLQIEWNKMHMLLSEPAVRARLEAVLAGEAWSDETTEIVRKTLVLDDKEWQQIRRLFGDELAPRLAEIAATRKDLYVNLLASSLTDYRRATQGWWTTIARQEDQLSTRQRPVYFVSSNTHSLINVLGGYAGTQEPEIARFLEERNPEGLREEYDRLRGSDPHRHNLLYYALRFFLRADRRRLEEREAWNRERGIYHITNPLYLAVDAQIIELKKLDPEVFDPRLKALGLDAERLRHSNALILNVDYPLGMAAYQLLSQVMESVGSIRGVYIMGKAATLNGRVGDVAIPNVVYDEQSQNTFLFRNCFTAQQVSAYLLFGTVFDNQKAITVRGTLLQNRDFMHLFYKEGYTDIEMEGGPYLSAIYENIYPRRYPVNEIVNLFINAHYDIGLLHYASDTPYSKRQELLSESLSYRGVDATYATTLAILERIFRVEMGSET